MWSWWGLFSAGAAHPLDARGGAVADDPVRVVWSDPASYSDRPTQRAPGRHFRGGRRIQLLYALIDVWAVVTNGVIAFLLRFAHAGPLQWFKGKFGLAAGLPYIGYEGFLFLYVGLILLFCDWQDLYRTPRMRSAFEESTAVVKAVSLATLLLTAFIFIFGNKFISRIVVAICLFLNAASLAAWRYAKRQIVIHRAMNGIGLRNAAIIGAGRVGRELARQLEENKLLGYEFKGFLDGNHSGDPRTLGKIEDLLRIAKSQFLDDVFITIPSERELVKWVVLEAQKQRLNIKVVPELYDGLCWNAPIQHVGDFPVMEVHWKAIPTLGLFVKRVFDISLSLSGLVLFSPLFLVLAAAIKLDSCGPALYRSRRVGKKGRPFTCVKFRTMVFNAEEMKESLRHRNERKGPFFKISNDPRITRLGKFLRNYSLDELPQLWNVLKGDMSLVGPRPHPLDDFQQYSLDHFCRLDVKPGITGLWQVKARHDPSFETNMKLDLEYIENWDLSLDLRILMLTIPVVFQGRGQ